MVEQVLILINSIDESSLIMVLKEVIGEVRRSIEEILTKK